ncbi:MAG: hypothetical protein IPM35_00090 [Myxococcales bacterium]|nr:hypothetical protein [Myxococcales bacterium]
MIVSTGRLTELCQVIARLGGVVTLDQFAPQALPRELFPHLYGGAVSRTRPRAWRPDGRLRSSAGSLLGHMKEAMLVFTPPHAPSATKTFALTPSGWGLAGVEPPPSASVSPTLQATQQQAPMPPQYLPMPPVVPQEWRDRTGGYWRRDGVGVWFWNSTDRRWRLIERAPVA